jgi:tetratricopeptide (TPR) repeat protein
MLVTSQQVHGHGAGFVSTKGTSPVRALKSVRVTKTDLPAAHRLELAGRLDEAAAVYQRLLESQPNHALAWDGLGRIAATKGQHKEACFLFVRAIEHAGPQPDFCVHLGNSLRMERNLPAAEACYRQALEALPGNLDILLELANTLHLAGKLREAITLFSQITTRRPQLIDAWYNLGVSQLMLSQVAEARAAFEQATRLNAQHAEAWNNLGLIDQSLSQLSAAEHCYRQALAAQPTFEQARYNLGTCLEEQGRYAEAAEWLGHVVASRPDFSEAHNNLGNALLKQNRVVAARDHFQKAIQCDANNRTAAWNFGFASLLLGDFAAGWPAYEHRLTQHLQTPRAFACAAWDGSSLHGKRILLHVEQGLGDTMQFIRLVHHLTRHHAADAADIFVECQPELLSLLGSLKVPLTFIPRGAPLPVVDCHAAITSLPALLKLQLNELPGAWPYLFADPTRADYWHEQLGPRTAKLRVGLAWAGNPNHRNDRNRSLPLPLFAPLLAKPDVEYFSLQKDFPGALPEGLRPFDPAISSFAETAAFLAPLDLVISVDTAICHLAGAMGKRVWTLLPFAPDFRWMLDRTDTPWYPSMRLFRQPDAGNWEAAIQHIKEELETLL